LYRVKDTDVVSIFCRQISSLPTNICEEAVFSQKLGRLSCMIHSWVFILFHWSSCCVLCLYHAVFMYGSVVWFEVVVYLQHHCFSQCYFGYSWTRWTLGWFYNLCDEYHWNFDEDGIAHVDSFW
jgi:hypothetical protein